MPAGQAIYCPEQGRLHDELHQQNPTSKFYAFCGSPWPDPVIIPDSSQERLPKRTTSLKFPSQMISDDPARLPVTQRDRRITSIRKSESSPGMLPLPGQILHQLLMHTRRQGGFSSV
jgi:hypothetical protein